MSEKKSLIDQEELQKEIKLIKDLCRGAGINDETQALALMMLRDVHEMSGQRSIDISLTALGGEVLNHIAFGWVNERGFKQSISISSTRQA